MKTLMLLLAGYALGRIMLHLIVALRCPKLWRRSIDGIKRELAR